MHRILLLGEGNLSFAFSFASNLKVNTALQYELIATCFDTEDATIG